MIRRNVEEEKKHRKGQDQTTVSNGPTIRPYGLFGNFCCQGL